MGGQPSGQLRSGGRLRFSVSSLRRGAQAPRIELRHPRPRSGWRNVSRLTEFPRLDADKMPCDPNGGPERVTKRHKGCCLPGPDLCLTLYITPLVAIAARLVSTCICVRRNLAPFDRSNEL